ncbi:MAG: type II toxin-antitoxin system mRNA interferase toxin, RelE/StbE family [bacterium]|nr:type II toxin-antitoxin system mRNA interferase toxin, RelE/StbE family [bacterium]
MLISELKGKRECHIEPDWLLIYEVRRDELILVSASAANNRRCHQEETDSVS